VTPGFDGLGEFRTTIALESPAFALISLFPTNKHVHTVDPEN